MAAPEFWSNPAGAKAVIEQANAERAVLNPFRELEKAVEDVGVMLELAGDDAGSGDLAAAEVAAELDRAEKVFRQLEVRSLLSGRFDRHNAYLTLHAGAGGTEACDWADMLLRMYRRYGEARGFDVTVLDVLPGEEAGIKSATLAVAGEYAYGLLSAERGVHRLVRISPFDANHRRHTSFASLDVVAELDEEDDGEVEIRDADLKVDTYRSGGAGGQHVNKTDSAIRITHLPTGLIVACQSERSQHMNRAKAMKLLRARLYELRQDEKRKELEKFYGDKGEIAWGRQIRSYVLQPYTLVKDHRTDFQSGQVAAVLEGELDGFIEAYLKHRRAAGNAAALAPAGGV
jgi:peptide chain release factor 2